MQVFTNLLLLIGVAFLLESRIVSFSCLDEAEASEKSPLILTDKPIFPNLSLNELDIASIEINA